MSKGLSIQIGPTNEKTGTVNAILNAILKGLDVLKMCNSVDSLEGKFGNDRTSVGLGTKGTVEAIGFTMMFGAFVGLGVMVIKSKRRLQDWHEKNSFSAWPLPIHASCTCFMASRTLTEQTKFGVLYFCCK
ncbi:hypothetical protein SLEP1_g3068 [Rubroshorea leprosula]|uniref:Uncharacterized protein n=1 Tax=Rubroshorea leprosula TaxID=152421 RepID=A0AAV5HJ50_9ROSI|nr:hypothetical protein SLEP1_g3068 [Rubroshorea leprosula]